MFYKLTQDPSAMSQEMLDHLKYLGTYQGNRQQFSRKFTPLLNGHYHFISIPKAHPLVSAIYLLLLFAIVITLLLSIYRAEETENGGPDKAPAVTSKVILKARTSARRAVRAKLLARRKRWALDFRPPSIPSKAALQSRGSQTVATEDIDTECKELIFIERISVREGAIIAEANPIGDRTLTESSSPNSTIRSESDIISEPDEVGEDTVSESSTVNGSTAVDTTTESAINALPPPGLKSEDSFEPPLSAEIENFPDLVTDNTPVHLGNAAPIPPPPQGAFNVAVSSPRRRFAGLHINPPKVNPSVDDISRSGNALDHDKINITEEMGETNKARSSTLTANETKQEHESTNKPRSFTISNTDAFGRPRRLTCAKAPDTPSTASWPKLPGSPSWTFEKMHSLKNRQENTTTTPAHRNNRRSSRTSISAQNSRILEELHSPRLPPPTIPSRSVPQTPLSGTFLQRRFSLLGPGSSLMSTAPTSANSVPRRLSLLGPGSPSMSSAVPLGLRTFGRRRTTLLGLRPEVLGEESESD